MKPILALAGLALATFVFVWFTSQSDQDTLGFGLVQESASEGEVGPVGGVEDLSEVEGEDRSALQAEKAGSQEQSEPGFEDALWCTGEVVLPEGTRLYPGSEVVSKGGLWADGTDERRVSVASDGTFKVPFAPSTYRGTVEFEGRGLNGRRIDIWRPWHSEPLYLYPQAKKQVVLHVVDEGSGSMGEIRVQSVGVWDFLKTLGEGHFVSGRGEGLFDCFQMGGPLPVILVSAPGRAPVMVTPKYQAVGQGDTIEVELHDPVQLSGRVVCSGGQLPESLWLGCDQPFRIRSGGAGELVMAIALDQGTFQIEVPAGIELKLRAGAKGFSAEAMTVPALDPGETRGGIVLEPTQQAGLKGRIVDLHGLPIVGAQIRSLVDLSLGGGSTQDAGMGAVLHTVSGEGGAFELFSLGNYSEVPIEVTVPVHSGFKLMEGGVWPAQQESQHYPHVPVSSGTQTLVYAPKAGGLKGRVLDPQGHAVASYTALLTPVGHRTRQNRNNSHSYFSRRRNREYSGLHQQASSGNSWWNRDYSAERTYRVEDPEGRFYWPSLPPGKWEFTVQAAGRKLSEPIAVSIPRSESLEVQLQEPASLTVRLVDDLGQPWGSQRLAVHRSKPDEDDDLFSSLALNAISPDPSTQGDRESDSDGLVHFSNLAPGHYQLLALGAHRKLLGNEELDLVQGEEKFVTMHMIPFGSARVDLVGARKQPLLLGRAHELGSSEAQAYARDRGRGLFFPELTIGEYELIFGIAGGGTVSVPLVPKTPLHIEQRTVSRLTVHVSQEMCSVEGHVSHNGSNPGAGRLKWVSLNKPIAVTNTVVDQDGHFEAFFSRSGEYRVVYFNKKNRALASHAQMNVPPGHTKGAVIRVQTCALTLVMRGRDEVEPDFIDLLPNSISLVDQHLSVLNFQGIKGVWTNGEAFFRYVPPGTYLVQQKPRGGPGEWRVVPGQTVELSGDSQFLQLEVLAEPLATLAGVCHIDVSEPHIRVNLRVWADPELKVLVREQAFRVGESVPFLIRGVTIGKVWVTVGRDFLRPKPQGSGDSGPKRPVFGPFIVPADGLVGLDLQVGVPR